MVPDRAGSEAKGSSDCGDTVAAGQRFSDLPLTTREPGHRVAVPVLGAHRPAPWRAGNDGAGPAGTGFCRHEDQPARTRSTGLDGEAQYEVDPARNRLADRRNESWTVAGCDDRQQRDADKGVRGVTEQVADAAADAFDREPVVDPRQDERRRLCCRPLVAKLVHPSSLRCASAVGLRGHPHTRRQHGGLHFGGPKRLGACADRISGIVCDRVPEPEEHR
jgi:hypothetical protein